MYIKFKKNITNEVVEIERGKKCILSLRKILQMR